MRHTNRVTRRDLLALAAAAAPLEAAPAIPIIDTHIHLFDPGRPQGVPWPPRDNPVLYQPALPDRYRKLAAPLGIKGAIEVEASPWLDDNQWVLDVAATDKIVVATVGNLEPGHPDFRRHLDRFRRNPLFRGIRYGNLWDRDLTAEIEKPRFMDDLKALAAADLSLDTANQTPALIRAALRISDRVPGLRLIIDHLPQMTPPATGPARDAYSADLAELGKRPTVFVKVSEVLRRVDGRVPVEPAFYRRRLDEMWSTFGEDRVLFGSDWPNSDIWAPFAVVLGVVRDYALRKGKRAAEKYFWKNSRAAYRWVKRDASQPGD